MYGEDGGTRDLAYYRSTHESANASWVSQRTASLLTLTDLLRGPNAYRKDRYASSLGHLPDLEGLVDPYALFVEPIQQYRYRRSRDVRKVFEEGTCRASVDGVCLVRNGIPLRARVLGALPIVPTEGSAVHHLAAFAVPRAFADTGGVQGLLVE